MSWKSIGRSLKGAAKKVGKFTGFKQAQGLVQGVKGLSGGGSDDDARSAAANSMVRKNVTRQAGSGAINFNTEESV